MSVLCEYVSRLQGRGGALEAPIVQATSFSLHPDDSNERTQLAHREVPMFSLLKSQVL